jgi:hypothetical protein
MTLQYTYDNKGRAIGVFIPISEWKKITKKHRDLTIEEENYIPSTKEEVLNGIKEGLKQVKLHRQGKLKLKTGQELLDEL